VRGGSSRPQGDPLRQASCSASQPPFPSWPVSSWRWGPDGRSRRPVRGDGPAFRRSALRSPYRKPDHRSARVAICMVVACLVDGGSRVRGFLGWLDSADLDGRRPADRRTRPRLRRPRTTPMAVGRTPPSRSPRPGRPHLAQALSPVKPGAGRLATGRRHNVPL
jgi:hypothetical protein